MRAGMSIAIKTVTISSECEGRIVTITSADTKNWGATAAGKRNRFFYTPQGPEHTAICSDILQ
jgi:hypothetical protein